MKDPGQPHPGLTASQCEVIVREWLAQTFRTYPEQTSRFLLKDQDPFTNPVGNALKTGLPILVEELAEAFNVDRFKPALAEIIRIRAIQDFTPGQAVGFIFSLKKIARDMPGLAPETLAMLESRIDELVLVAFDLYAECRERTWEIKLNEAKRRVYVPERIASRRASH